jgi:hypothetical protein
MQRHNTSLDSLFEHISEHISELGFRTQAFDK